jgi:hypothetical protein
MNALALLNGLVLGSDPPAAIRAVVAHSPSKGEPS